MRSRRLIPLVFNSLTFVVFFAIVYSFYRILSHRAQNILLLLASYVFYGWWNWRFLGLILLSTLVDYSMGLAIERARTSKQRKAFLAVSVSANLGLLGVFKYAGFFLESLKAGFASFGLILDASIFEIILPVGISFYTFQTMSYTIDIYRHELKPTRHFLDFALFVAFFPQLVAGPIERARVLLPQLTSPRRIRREDVEESCWLILSGYYLKCVLADNLTPFVEKVFETPESAHGLEILVGIWAAAFQIYGDFSGYSRIAIGIAGLMGVRLMSNFNRPYLATSPQDFWRRWHISLSTWLRDYLYIPLGGSRGADLRTYRNLLITMVLGGLWHGAAWNFVAWGLFHGGILCLWRLWSKRRRSSQGPDSRPRKTRYGAFKTAVFFHVTCIGWVLFFVKDLSSAVTLLINLTKHWEWNGLAGLVTLLVFATPMMIAEVISERRGTRDFCSMLESKQRFWVYILVWTVLLICGAVDRTEFIYFQF